MRYLSADKIHNGYSFLPADSVIVINDNNVIEDVIHSDEAGENSIEHFAGILCPGLINTHCHLELSYLKGKLSEGNGLHEFIKEIELLKKPADEEILQAITAADKEMYESGIAAVGDICNTSATFRTKITSGIYYHNFFEVYAFDPSRADAAFARGLKLEEEWKMLVTSKRKNYSIVPHAPYSASVQLLRKIADHAYENESILSMHMQENEDENFLFLNKSGKILDRLKHFGIDTEPFIATEKNSLESSIIHLPRDRKMLLVHNTFMNADDIEFALDYSSGIYFCFCPNANFYIERRLPDIKLFTERFCNITLGTDSYASNYSLSIADEINMIMESAPYPELNEVMVWATSNGAEFLEIDDWAGSFEKGKRPGVVLLTQEGEKLRSKRII